MSRGLRGQVVHVVLYSNRYCSALFINQDSYKTGTTAVHVDLGIEIETNKYSVMCQVTPTAVDGRHEGTSLWVAETSTRL